MAAAAGGPYTQSVVNELWLELRYMVEWINTGQVHRVDLYWALEILRILDVSHGIPRGHYTLCRETIIRTAHEYNIVPKFQVKLWFKRFASFHIQYLCQK